MAWASIVGAMAGAIVAMVVLGGAMGRPATKWLDRRVTNPIDKLTDAVLPWFEDGPTTRATGSTLPELMLDHIRMCAEQRENDLAYRREREEHDREVERRLAALERAQRAP